MDERAVRCPCGDDGSEVPEGIVDGCDSSAVPRVCDLGDQEWACGIGNVAAHTHDEAASEKHGLWIRRSGESLDDRTEDDEKTSNRCACSTSQNIGDVWCEEEYCEPAEARECTKQSETRARGVLEDWRG